MVLRPAHKVSIQALSNRRCFTMRCEAATVFMGQFNVVSQDVPLRNLLLTSPDGRLIDGVFPLVATDVG